MNCFMTGDALSCNLRSDHVVILFLRQLTRIPTKRVTITQSLQNFSETVKFSNGDQQVMPSNK